MTTETSQFISILGFAAPLISALVCLVVLGVFLSGGRTAVERKLSLLLVVELVACACCWFTLIAYVTDMALFVHLKVPFYLCILYAQVTTYHYVFTLTRTGKEERFSPWHYIVPAVLALALLIWSTYVPVDIKIAIARSDGSYPDGYGVYAFFFNSNRYMFLFSNLFYSGLSLRRIAGFKKALEDYSADEGHSSVRWLRILIFAALCSIPLSMIPALLGMNRLAGSLIAAVSTLFIVLKDVILIYHTVVGKYILIEPQQSNKPTGTKYETDNGSRPDKERFERYIQQYKPYLNPRLRITDITGELGTNRTYLSGFINRTYGMNFNRYINRWRLREVEKLRVNPAYMKLSGLELVQKAGFSNFAAYLRIKAEEDKRSTLPLN